MFKPPCLLDLQVAPTLVLSHRAAKPFTPRIPRLVTCPGLWHRYMPESGNWHDGTFTRWIAALSVAPHPFYPKIVLVNEIRTQIGKPSLANLLFPFVFTFSFTFLLTFDLRDDDNWMYYA